MVSCFYSTLQHRGHWIRVFVNVSKLNRIILRQGYRDDTNLAGFIFKIGILHILYCLVHLYELLNWLKKEASILEHGYILYRVITYYQLIFTLFFISVTQVLQKRIVFLRRLLKDTLQLSSLESELYFRLLEFRDLYGILDVIVQSLNVIFGGTLFLNIVTYIIIILVNMNYILQFTRTNDVEFKTGIILTNGMYVIIYTVNIKFLL